MAKHWLMQPIYRDRKTSQIIGRGRPKTAPPATAAQWIKQSPGEWECIDSEYEVPDTWRTAPESVKVNWTEEKVQDEFYTGRKMPQPIQTPTQNQGPIKKAFPGKDPGKD